MQRVLGLAGALVLLLCTGVTAGCGSRAAARTREKPAALALTAKDVGAPRSDDTGPADLLDEAPEALFKALPKSDGHPTWQAFGAAYKSVGVYSLAVTLPSEDSARRLLQVAPRLARFEGMSGGRVVRPLPIGDAAVLVKGRVLTPVGQIRTGAAVVFREKAVVGVVAAQTAADAIRLAKVQAAKIG